MIGTHISLFAGVGMTDIAVERLGFKTVATAEIDPWCRKVLKERYPDAHHFGDVKDVRMTASARHRVGASPSARKVSKRGQLLISGGFPCQDVSSLGRGVGVSGPRSGLWNEFARVIADFRPDIVLIENSPLLRSRGLDTVLFDLYMRGYDARWDCIPAAAVGALHLRDRIFIVAWPRRYEDRHEAHNHDNFIGAINGPMMGFTTAGKLYRKRGSESLTKLPRAGSLYDAYIREDVPQYPIKAARARAGVPLWPTPRRAANEWRTTRNAPSHGNGHGKTLAGEINDRERARNYLIAPSSDSAGNVNPEWVEWLMGLPLGWTSLAPGGPNAYTPTWSWLTEPWPVSRTAHDVPDRRNRLQALGNGVVWQCVTEALKMHPDLNH